MVSRSAGLGGMRGARFQWKVEDEPNGDSVLKRVVIGVVPVEWRMGARIERWWEGEEKEEKEQRNGKGSQEGRMTPGGGIWERQPQIKCRRSRRG